MSQEKVDKRKYEKHHRKEIERKKKIKTAVTCISAALIVGAVVGIPLGIKIYKEQPKFVGDSTLKAFVANYIDESYSEDVELVKKKAEETEATETTEVEDVVKEAVEEASGQEVEEVDADNVEEVLGTDSEETEASETEE